MAKTGAQHPRTTHGPSACRLFWGMALMALALLIPSTLRAQGDLWSLGSSSTNVYITSTSVVQSYQGTGNIPPNVSLQELFTIMSFDDCLTSLSATAPGPLIGVEVRLSARIDSAQFSITSTGTTSAHGNLSGMLSFNAQIDPSGIVLNVNPLVSLLNPQSFNIGPGETATGIWTNYDAGSMSTLLTGSISLADWETCGLTHLLSASAKFEFTTLISDMQQDSTFNVGTATLSGALFADVIYHFEVPVPEPGTWVLILGGGASLSLWGIKRKRNQRNAA